MDLSDALASLDGHLPHNIDFPAQTCFFAAYCLPDQFFTEPTLIHSSEDVFTRLAFDRPQCGDCLIDALMTASGERGLEAFLPDSEATFTPSTSSEETGSLPRSGSGSGWDSGPILPLTNDWRTTNFSLHSVLSPSSPVSSSSDEEEEGINLRSWCLELLSRYVYTIGSTPALFAPVSSAVQLHRKLTLADSKGMAMICVNDDIDESLDENAAGMFGEVLKGWMEDRWPHAGGWERDTT